MNKTQPTPEEITAVVSEQPDLYQPTVQPLDAVQDNGYFPIEVDAEDKELAAPSLAKLATPSSDRNWVQRFKVAAKTAVSNILNGQMTHNVALGNKRITFGKNKEEIEFGRRMASEAKRQIEEVMDGTEELTAEEAETWAAALGGGSVSMVEFAANLALLRGLGAGSVGAQLGAGWLAGRAGYEEGTMSDIDKYIAETGDKELKNYKGDKKAFAVNVVSGAIQGGVEAATSGLGRYLINNPLAKKVLGRTGRDAIRKLAATAVGRALGAGANEAVNNAWEEGIQVLTGNVAEIVKGNEEFSMDNILNGAGQAAGVGAILGWIAAPVMQEYGRRKTRDWISDKLRKASEEKGIPLTETEIKDTANDLLGRIESKGVQKVSDNYDKIIQLTDSESDLAQTLSRVFEDLVNQGQIKFRQATPDEIRQAGLDWANWQQALALLDSLEREIPLSAHPLFNAVAEVDRILLEGRDPGTGDLLPLDINNAQVRELANQIEDYIEQNRETRQAEEASKLVALREADMRARQETIQELERAAIAELEKEQAANNQERITELQQQITELQHQMDLLREERSKYIQERAAQGRISIGRAKAQTAPDNKTLTKKAIRSGNLDIITQILQDNGFKTRDLSGTQIKQMAQLNWEMFADKDLGTTKSKFDKNVAMKAIEQNVVSGDAVLLRAGYTQGQIDQMDDKTWNRALLAAYREEAEALESVQPQLTPEQAAQIPDDLLFQPNVAAEQDPTSDSVRKLKPGETLDYEYGGKKYRARNWGGITIALLGENGNELSNITINTTTNTVSDIRVMNKEDEGNHYASTVLYEAERIFGDLQANPEANEKAQNFWKRVGFTEKNNETQNMQRPTYQEDTIVVDGIERPIENNLGGMIARTEKGLTNFWRWFGDSKVVNDQGRPLVVYHGTKDEFDSFKQGEGHKHDAGFLGTGFYFTDKESSAMEYTEWKRGYSKPTVLSVYLKANNPLVLKERGATLYNRIIKALQIPLPEKDFVFRIEKPTSDLITNESQKQGYDSVIADLYDGEVYYVVYNPNQIKHTENKGAFGIGVDDMYHQDQIVKKVGEDRTNANKWLKEQKKVVDAAVDYYGLTDDINEAGYILPDGGLLDFSGKGMGGMPGRRAFDHREIAAAFDEDVIGKPSPFPELVVMEEFINAGNIRFLPESGTFLMAHKPTPAQYRTIERVMDQRNGEIQIEFVSDAEKWGSHIAENFYYEMPEYSSIQDIKRLANAFFDGEGITQGMLTLSEEDYYYQNTTVENPVLVDVEDIASDLDTENVLDLVLSGQNLWDNLIDPAKYKSALLEFVKNGQLLRTKTEDVEKWFETIVRNTALLDKITDIVGHSAWFPETEIKEYFFGTDRAEADRKFQEYKKQLQERDEELPPEFADTESTADKEISDMAVLWKLLEDKGFFDKAALPDGSPAWSDYGLRPLWDIIGEYREGMPAEQVLVLINKALDVYHQNGDLVSAFIKGGAEVANQISNDVSQESVQFQDQPQAKLIATHNMSKEGLERALDLGGLVMPKTAALKDLTEKRPWTLLQNKKTSKSTTGLGTEHRGGYDPMTKAIIFNKTSDLTTLFHESAHYWFDRNLRYYRTGLASPEWKKKWEDVMNELGATPNARGTIPVSAIRSASEKFARSMEAYLREGKYESAAIQWAHQDYANMVKRIYRNIWSTYWGLNDLSPAVKQWFDMFGLKTDDATTAFAEEDQIETDEQMVGAVIAEDATEPDVDAETKTIVADAGAQVVENPATQEIAIVPADPFETGKKARSKLPRSAEAATGVSMDDIIYNRRSMSDAFKAAQQLVNTDPVRAWEILKGGQEMVDGLYAGDIYRALVAKYQAENNPTMLKNVVQAFAGAARRAGRSVKAFDLESPRISFEKTINSLDKIFDTKKNDKRIEKVKNELKEFLHDPSALRVGWEEFKNIVGCK